MYEEGNEHFRSGYEAGLSYFELNGGLEDAGMPDPINPHNGGEAAAQCWEKGFFEGYEQACEMEEMDRWALDGCLI